jgi:hypothetical protein
MTTKKKLLFSILVLTLATLACGLPTPATGSDEPNFEATLLAVTIAALEQTQNAPAAAPTDDQAVDPPASTNTPIPDAPAAPAATNTPSKPMLSVNTNTNCRSGPGLKYPITGSITIGGSFEVTAQAPSPEPYVIIKNPGGGADCWAWLQHATVTGDISSLPTLPVPQPPLGSIKGFLWLEDCDDTNPGSSCVGNSNTGISEGDGIFSNESFLQGVVVELFSGKCSSTTSVKTAPTDSNGAYKFDNLEAGTYCIVIDTFKHSNDTILLNSTFGGIFTFPLRANDLQTHQIDLLPGKHISGFNFGWDDFEQ